MTRLAAWLQPRFTRAVALKAAFLSVLVYLTFEEQGLRGWWMVPLAGFVLYVNLIANEVTAFNPQWSSREGKLTVALVLGGLAMLLAYFAMTTSLRWWEPLAIFAGLGVGLGVFFGSIVLLLKALGMFRFLVDTFPSFFGAMMLCGFVIGALSLFFPSLGQTWESHSQYLFAVFFGVAAIIGVRNTWRRIRKGFEV